MGESLGAEPGSEGGSSGDMSGGELEGSELVDFLISESGTEVGTKGM